jgi:cobalt-zinc-cadmium efflux system protein
MHARRDDARALLAALGLTCLFLVVEVIGGWLTNSLALLSDAAHMFTDAGALTLSLFALWVARRPASDRKTFGYHRAEILAALLNGVALCLIVAWIFHEAYGRLREAPPVHSAGMILVASGGIVVNVVCAWLLAPHSRGSLNVRAAFVHVVADLFGSVGALAAGGVMLLTGWYAADALAAFLIGALVLLGAWRLMRESLDVLMEAVPPHIDLDELRRDLETVRGTQAVHDLHVWTLTTGRYALSAHAVIDGSVDGDRILDRMRVLLAERFNIAHVTIQLERARPCEPESVHA